MHTPYEVISSPRLVDPISPHLDPSPSQERQKLVDDGTWELVEKSEPLPYLPLNPVNSLRDPKGL